MTSLLLAIVMGSGLNVRTPRLRLPPPPRIAVTAVADDRIEIASSGGRVAVVTIATGGTHRWNRTTIVHPTHVEIRDTVTNTTTTIIGLRVRHAVEAAAPSSVVLGGRSGNDVRSAYDPWNPTVFVVRTSGGVGLVAEDDVFRQQLYVDYDAGTAGLRTDMLCLAPGDRYTMTWSIYPSRTSSYWDFVNTVRQDWGVNQIVDGSHVWFTPDEILAAPRDELRAALARKRVRYASMLGGWVDPRRDERPPLIGFGTFVMGREFADYRARLTAAFAKLKSTRSEMSVLAYFDAQRDSSPAASERHADSVLTTPTGVAERVDWDGRYSAAWSMVPTADDSFGRAMLGVARRMRKLGADGVYWDEMDGVDFARPRTTASRWDRRSCVLAADGGVEQRVGLVNLLSAKAKLRYAGAGVVIGNFPPTTGDFQRYPAVRMVEVHRHPEWSAFAHLTTPLGYVGADRAEWRLVRAVIDAGLLPVGGAWNAALDLAARLFPLTPEYIQPGTVRGRERIVTTESGIHGWADFAGAVRAFRYDASGRESEVHWRFKHLRGGTYVRVRLSADEVAVIERDVSASSP